MFDERGVFAETHRALVAGQVEYRFDYDAFIAGKSPNANMLLEPGDTIVVPD